ncbi:MAG: SDR family NAD(P)-dependent oxidoreductase [Actinomycetota bacterium]
MEISPDKTLLTDKVAVVTGGAQGIGAATAVALAAFGADVAICDFQADKMPAVGAQIEALGRRAHLSELDVRDEPGVAAWMSAVSDELGSIDILVNNAGGGFHALYRDVSPKGEGVLIAENFGTVSNCIRHGVPLMNDGGAIVNVTSVEAYHAAPGFGVYSAMKAAVEQFTKTMSMELGHRGIRVNCVAPDMMPTPGDEELQEDSSALMPGLFPTSLRRMGSAEECASVIVFLASEMASFVTGTSIPVDGGTIAAASWKIREDGTFGL